MVSIFYLHGKELRKIAREMNISITTVKSQKAHARELQRKRLTYLPIFFMAALFLLLRS